MCLQCIVQSEKVIDEIIPGYSIHRAKVEATNVWPADYYGLIDINNPTFVFPEIPTPPLDTDDFPSPFDQLVINYNEVLLSAVEGYRFVKACMDAGYNLEDHGYNVFDWFFRHVYARLHPV